ncbi:actin monomer binding protein-like protein [Patellaria atrata CBS 101060]|uniref:Twinfilin n=1 Tax=Patellaria atrata CBS 101060 TaxID=1346257 RepID=A0A9P4S5T3_9PEZI|nr:actin monomer binding protein-like protein [Patellaria atrata CBS 101060]
MQSGISASQELQDAFNALLTDPSSRGLTATIQSESIVPLSTIPSSGPFHTDLAALQPLLKDTQALYILLRRDPDSSATNVDGSPVPSFIAVTYVPDAAPVRQKTLVASTRLTLTRELGSEWFAESLFVTDREELGEEGWRRYEGHEAAEKPLSREERDLEGIREAEARESGGTTGKRGHAAGVVTRFEEGVGGTLRGLRDGSEGNLVQLKFDVASETVHVASIDTVDTAGLATTISASAPRYSFYRHVYGSETAIMFIYTCPTASKIKERMLYASGRAIAISTAEKEGGFTVAKKLEASNPDEVTADLIEEEFAPKQEVSKAAFSRPKRPGRR